MPKGRDQFGGIEIREPEGRSIETKVETGPVAG